MIQYTVALTRLYTSCVFYVRLVTSCESLHSTKIFNLPLPHRFTTSRTIHKIRSLYKAWSWPGTCTIHCLRKTVCFKPLWRWLDAILTIHYIQQKIELLCANAFIDQLTNFRASLGRLDTPPSNSQMHRPIQCERLRANRAAPPTRGGNYKLYQIIKQLQISTSCCLSGWCYIIFPTLSLQMKERQQIHYLASTGKSLTPESALLLPMQSIPKCRGMVSKHSIQSSRERTSSAITAAKR